MLVCHPPCCRKLAGILQTLESESEFLFDPAKKQKLPSILKAVLDELNQHGRCAIPVDEVNTIHLRLSTADTVVIRAHEHQVGRHLHRRPCRPPPAARRCGCHKHAASLWPGIDHPLPCSAGASASGRP